MKQSRREFLAGLREISQRRSFLALVEYLDSDWLSTLMRFAGHGEIYPGRTVCPGRHFPVAAIHARFG